MTAKQAKPATPLPWIVATREGMAAQQYGACIYSEHFNRPGVVDGRGSVAEVRGPGTVESANQNAAYIVHACNAYPELVATLRKAEALAVKSQRDGLTMEDTGDFLDEARALLAKLGAE